METWERIEERLKFIEKRIEEIRRDLEEMKPKEWDEEENDYGYYYDCLLYTSPSPRDVEESRMPSSA